MTPEQKERQKTRVQILDNKILHKFDMENFVVPDESYFTLDGIGMPGNSGLYATCSGDTPFKVYFKTKSKFPPPLLVWCAISAK